MYTLSSVNLGTEQELGGTVSGIYKISTTGSVQLTEEGLVGDVVSDSRHHGGPDQAVYVYGGDDYDWWNEQLLMAVEPGTFGDNLTISGLSCRDVSIGDRFTIGNSVELQATAPRIPCATLGHRMGDKHFPVMFKKAERPGFYCRVINAGFVEQGLEVEHSPMQQEDPVSVLEMFHLYYDPQPDQDKVLKALNTPIAIRERRRLESKLDRSDR